jgi:flagellar basal body-associated protein FliL|tara:strand:- start:380 stop:643 length:264 start_codon:yes stop_codon:yes gene_type:complete
MVIWILSILLLVAVFIIFNLFRKNEKLEESNEESIEWLLSYSNSLSSILNNIKELDSKNMFESDDEVGSVFKSIVSEIKKLENLFDN